MPDEKCIVRPELDCVGSKRAEEVAQEAKSRTEIVERSLEEFKRSTASTHQRFGERIGALESDLKLEKREVEHINGRLDNIERDIDSNHREQKESIRELRNETKDALQELKRGNQEILDIVRPLEYKMGGVEKRAEKNESEVSRIKEEPGKKYEGYKDKFVAAIIGFFGTTFGGAILWLLIQSAGK